MASHDTGSLICLGKDNGTVALMELSDGFVTSPNMRVNIELSKLGWMSSMNSQGGQGQPGDHVRQGEQEGENIVGDPEGGEAEGHSWK